MRWPVRLVLALLMGVFVMPARGQAVPVGLSARGSVSSGLVEVAHGWVVLQQGGDSVGPRSVLAHLPPRNAPGEGAGGGGAPAGTAKRARSLIERPEAIAAEGSRVVLIFAPDEGATLRRVLSLRAVATALDDVWKFDPPERLNALPPLEAPGRLHGLGFVGGALVAVLGEGGGANAATLGPEGWSVAALDVPGEARLYADGDVGWVAWREGDGLVARELGPGGRMGEPRSIGSIPAARLPDAFAGGEFAWLVAGTAGAGEGDDSDETGPESGGARVLAWRPGAGSVRTVSRFDLPGPAAAAVPMGERGSRLVVLAEVPTDEQLEYHAVELSMVSGEGLYGGPVRRALPVSPEEFRFLAVVLVALTAATLLIAVRPGSGPDAGVCDLPEGVSLADPAARAAATLVDLVLASWAVSALVDVGPGGFGLAWIFNPAAWIGLPVVLATAAALATTCEAVFGRTPGKAIFGCRVVRCGGADVRTPGVTALLMRNLIKWLLPPLTVLSLIDGSGGRHRGDAIARVAVVSRVSASPDPDRGEGDGG